MNKIINLLSLVLFAVFGFFAIGSIYDLGFSVYEINDIPYIKQIGYGITLLILLLGVIRIKRRIEGRKDINAYSKFVFKSAIAKSTIKNASVSLGIEIAFGIAVTAILIKFNSVDEQNLVLPLLVIVLILVAENSIYLIYFRKNQDRFKIGIGPQFLAYFDREMHLYYYKGLTRVEVYQNMINFRYKKELNLFLNINIIPQSKQKQFFETLQQTLASKNIFFDDSFHQYVSGLQT